MHQALWTFLLLAPVSAKSQEAASPPQPVRCETGPVTRTFGGTEWIVYSCEDEVSLVVVSAIGSPASPFFFLLRPNAESYEIVGEGSGDKRATDAARADLSKLGSAKIAALLAETKAANRVR